MAQQTYEQRKVTLNRYRGFMKEIKLRVASIDRLAKLAREKQLEMWEVEQFAYLQLRMICELIVRGCLVAHNEVLPSDTGEFSTQWRIKNILKALEKRHPNFYPTPGTLLDEHGKPFTFQPGTYQSTIKVRFKPRQKSDYLTRNELEKIVNVCGDKLHPRPTKDMFKKRDMDFTPLNETIRKVQSLLSLHRLEMADPRYFLWINMGNEGPNPQGAILINPQS